MKSTFLPVYILGLLFIFAGCNDQTEEDPLWPERNLSADFKDYWFNGEAEITSYALDQSRYGEPRTGTAVLIYVTEDFLSQAQVKADEQNKDNIPVLKLNATKNFTTGIYPYSIMQSTFLPVAGTSHALKITTSIQEWCGQVFMQLNNRDNFKIRSYSYFATEGDQDLELKKTFLENEIWTQLRIDPESLPTGDLEMIPSFEFIRLAHIDIKSYKAFAEFFLDEDLGVYQITYPHLNRELRIYYQPNFPFLIEKWEEVTQRNGEMHKTTAVKMESIRSPYWSKNTNNDLPLRDNLNLE